jgi:site-specific DNA-methyltransferase (adenine-specific)
MIRKEVIGGCELYLGDCREILPTLGPVDAVVTDPPYGISYSQGVNRSKRGGSSLANIKVPPRMEKESLIEGDDAPFDPALLFKASGQVICWGANFYVADLPLGTWLVWDKRCGVYGHLDQADAEIGWCSSGRSVRVFRWLWTGLVRKKVEKAPDGANIKRHHPFEKPVELMEWCIGWFDISPQSILDPFMGSGTTGVACVRLGRRFVGVEIDQAHFDTACRRIDAATRQPDLFVAPPEPNPHQLSLMEVS